MSADTAAIRTCCQSAVETGGGCEVGARPLLHMTASFLKYTLIVATSYENRSMNILLPFVQVNNWLKHLEHLEFLECFPEAENWLFDCLCLF